MGSPRIQRQLRQDGCPPGRPHCDCYKKSHVVQEQGPGLTWVCGPRNIAQMPVLDAQMPVHGVDHLLGHIQDRRGEILSGKDSDGMEQVGGGNHVGRERENVSLLLVCG